MTPSKIFLSGSTADGRILQMLTQALVARAIPVFVGPPSGPTAGDTASTAVVLVISQAALASPEFTAALERYQSMVAGNSSIVVAPVLLEPVTREMLPPWLRSYPPVSVSTSGSELDTAIVDGVLGRLELAGPRQASSAPELDPTVPLATLLPPAVALSAAGIPLRAREGRLSELPTAVMPAARGELTWRDHLKRRRRPLAIGAGAALALLLLACVAFSLGVGSPGGGADRLGSGVSDPSGAAQVTATASASAAPSANPTRERSTVTSAQGTPTGHAPTPTSTPVLPTPTLGPGVGLHGDYYHSTVVSPGNPVPYPNCSPDCATAWFSKTDPIIDMGYENRINYNPPLSPFQAPPPISLCPSPPTSSPCVPFDVHWTGFVRPRYSETYTFTMDSDDGVKLWVNGQKLVDNWSIHGDTPNSGTISLTAGQLTPIEIWYYENGQGPAVVVLQWQSASQALEVIPTNQLYPPS